MIPDSRAIGTLVKQDFECAVLNGIRLMENEPAHCWRETLFLCDAYQGFATVAGESDTSGSGGEESKVRLQI